MIDILRLMGWAAGLGSIPSVSSLEKLINAIELPNVDLARLRQCKEQESIMYWKKREGMDESKMTFSYLDIVWLRILYEWQSAGNKPK